MIDLHNHLMPGVDDGAADLSLAREAVRLLRDQGVETIVTTPHFEASLTRSPERCAARLAELDAAWGELAAMAAADFPGLRLERGVELMLDTPSPDLSDPRLRLAGTSFVLVEFPGFAIPPNTDEVMAALVRGGYHPVVAHPERYAELLGRTDRLGSLMQRGCHFQVNCASPLGRYGESARAIALDLLERGWVSYLSSDYHARGRPRMRECRDLLLSLGAEEQADLLMEENLQRLLSDQPPHPVPPVSSRPGWRERLRRLFRT